MSTNRPAGRGGRGAALLQMLNQQVRTPGEQGTQPGSSQQSGGAVGGGIPQPGDAPFGGPPPPGARGTAPQQAAAMPRPPHAPVAASQGPVEQAQAAAPTRGRGAMLQQFCEVQAAQQQQPPVSLGASSSETETGQLPTHHDCPSSRQYLSTEQSSLDEGSELFHVVFFCVSSINQSA